MAWMYLTTTCCNCGKIFNCNPHTVPTANGEPICKPCVEWANPQRLKLGLAPIPMLPDSYSPVEE